MADNKRRLVCADEKSEAPSSGMTLYGNALLVRGPGVLGGVWLRGGKEWTSVILYDGEDASGHPLFEFSVGPREVEGHARGFSFKNGLYAELRGRDASYKVDYWADVEGA